MSKVISSYNFLQCTPFPEGPPPVCKKWANMSYKQKLLLKIRRAIEEAKGF